MQYEITSNNPGLTLPKAPVSWEDLQHGHILLGHIDGYVISDIVCTNDTYQAPEGSYPPSPTKWIYEKPFYSMIGFENVAFGETFPDDMPTSECTVHFEPGPEGKPMYIIQKESEGTGPENSVFEYQVTNESVIRELRVGQSFTVPSFAKLSLLGLYTENSPYVCEGFKPGYRILGAGCGNTYHTLSSPLPSYCMYLPIQNTESNTQTICKFTNKPINADAKETMPYIRFDLQVEPPTYQRIELDYALYGGITPDPSVIMNTNKLTINNLTGFFHKPELINSNDFAEMLPNMTYLFAVDSRLPKASELIQPLSFVCTGAEVSNGIDFMGKPSWLIKMPNEGTEVRCTMKSRLIENHLKLTLVNQINGTEQSEDLFKYTGACITGCSNTEKIDKMSFFLDNNQKHSIYSDRIELMLKDLVDGVFELKPEPPAGTILSDIMCSEADPAGTIEITPVPGSETLKMIKGFFTNLRNNVTCTFTYDYQ